MHPGRTTPVRTPEGGEVPDKKRRLSGRFGLSPREERVFRWLALPVVLSVMAAWTAVIVDLHAQKVEAATSEATPAVARTVASSLLDPRAPATAYIEDTAVEFLDALRGESGKLRAAFRTPRSELATGGSDPGVSALYEDASGAPVAADGLAAPGVYKIAVEIGKARRAIEDLRLITLVPFSRKRGERIGLYYLGSWPYEKAGTPRSRAYANPAGFIEVTRENKSTPVSEHFKLEDFLTKDQYDVWPKYLVLDPHLLDKLELVILELEARGHKVENVQIMSGFRTPRYNHSGGNTGGRANLSRHLYGDAADVFVDNDRNGTMDDLNRDGRVDVADSEVVAAAAERVEAEHPALVGGIGIYRACCGHGPFTHVDVRGYRARWRGTGDG